jgi:hypothetical protein
MRAYLPGNETLYSLSTLTVHRKYRKYSIYRHELNHAQQAGAGVPCLVPWARHARTRDFCPDLAALVCPVPNIFFQFHFICPQRSAIWAGNRAGSPVAKYVTLVLVNLVRVGYTYAEIYRDYPRPPAR